uniref:Uncharacterized protein n=1 Tax=Anguilla anguilla TaxID=7936 RepID=A0A0E9R849_ANGAN
MPLLIFRLTLLARLGSIFYSIQQESILDKVGLSDTPCSL